MQNSPWITSDLAVAQEELQVVTTHLGQSKQTLQQLKVVHQRASDAGAEREKELQKLVMEAHESLKTTEKEYATEDLRMQEKHAGMVEDIRMEAKEMLKKGTANLQHALKGTQAQLQVWSTS